MQILKGDVFKSVTVNCIQENNNCISFIYYDNALLLDGFYIDSKKNSLVELKEYIKDYIKNELVNINKSFEYMIIYTNNTEDELTDLIKWLKEKENKIGVSCILVACKP